MNCQEQISFFMITTSMIYRIIIISCHIRENVTTKGNSVTMSIFCLTNASTILTSLINTISGWFGLETNS